MSEDLKKTNVMRLLEREKVDYKEHHYLGDDVNDSEDVAAKMQVDPNQMYKTLVTEGKDSNHYVFMVPVNEELDLKKAAKAVGVKSVSMIKQDKLEPLTGYIHGGCSPIGMKREFQTTIHETASYFDSIVYSAGKRGRSVETSLEGLQAMVDGLIVADIIKD